MAFLMINTNRSANLALSNHLALSLLNLTKKNRHDDFNER